MGDTMMKLFFILYFLFSSQVLFAHDIIDYHYHHEHLVFLFFSIVTIFYKIFKVKKNDI